MTSKKYDWARWNCQYACDGGINGVIDGMTEAIAAAFATWFAPLARAIGLPGLSVEPLSRGFEDHLDENREEIFEGAVKDFDGHLEETREAASEQAAEYLVDSGQFVSEDEYASKCSELEEVEEERDDLQEKLDELEENDGFLSPCPHCPDGKLDGSTVDKTAFICDTCRTEFRLILREAVPTGC